MLFCRLISGVLGVVKSVSFENGIPELGIKTDEERNLDRFVRDVSSSSRISRFPMLRDPYEDERVEVAQSKLPQAGEGLFAKKDLKAGELAALYNGIRLCFALLVVNFSCEI